MLLAAFSLVVASGVEAAPVPFVGCPSDGQQGPQPPPPRRRTPDVAPSAASRLAYYVTFDEIGVLAPRGWHCFGTEGSNGTGLIVAPRPLDWETVTSGTLTGPVIRLQQTSGETSGRFEVAEVAARVFPAARLFVADVEHEGLLDKPFKRGPYPADRRRYRGAYQLLYTTPAHAKGLGTRMSLAPESLPIDGVEWLHPNDGMDLTSLAVRLPPGLRPLVAEIIGQATPPPPRRPTTAPLPPS